MSNKITINDKVEETSYSNTARVYSSDEELFIDFGTSRRGDNNITVNVNNKVAMTYQSAKRLAISLGEHLRMHENRFGEIDIERPTEKK